MIQSLKQSFQQHIRKLESETVDKVFFQQNALLESVQAGAEEFQSIATDRKA